LFRSEAWWRDHYDDIKLCGYQLRPRYRPGWVPSWKHSHNDFFSMEDGQPCLLRAGMDAIRIHDGKRVMLKKVLPEEGPHELQISRMFSARGVATNSRNHCHQLMVMPFLRPFDNPHFQTFGDCTANNIMLDPSRMYPDGFHPTQINRRPDFRGRAKRHTRTGRPPRYYLIDFGLAREYASRDAFDAPLRGGDRSAPEHRDGGRCNPFQTDIYYLGNLIREEFIQKYHGFEFMNELVSEMTHSEPVKRPLIEEVVVRFARIRESLSGFKLRSPMMSNKHPSLFTAFHYARQAIRSFYYVVSNQSAIPQH
ncbi:hypothetical protein EDB89DRAFT_2010447, partial [Lactarius sanguifluus]